MPNGDRRHLTPVALVIATAMVLGIGFMAASCFLDRRGDAEDLDHQIRAMPGVADTDMAYNKNMTSGENFHLIVTLQQDITEQQIRDVGRYFANRTDQTGLAERSADLFLTSADCAAASIEKPLRAGLPVSLLFQRPLQHRP